MQRLFLPFILFFGLSAEAHILEVCPTCPINKINDAVQKSNPFDTVLVGKGVYQEYNIHVTKPLALISRESAIIDGQEKGTIILFESDSITLDGFTVRNVGLSYTEDYAAVKLSHVDHFTLRNNILENVFFGFLVEKSHFGIIENNTVSGERTLESSSGNGIHLWHCDHVLIRKNEAFNLRDGIYLEFVSESRVEDNVSYDNLRYGLHFMFSNNDSYTNNVFKKNGAGVAVMFSKFITMVDNVFEENWGTASYGLLLKEIYDADIKGNQFVKNTIGIHIEGCTRINYYGNTFQSNGWAIKVAGACYSNHFERNNFLQNAFDVSYNSKLNDNTFNSNYWSDYTGYDLDKDGVGDVPHRPVKLFSYVVNRTPESIVLLRSLFVDIINFSEKVSPVFTPDALIDNSPLMKKNS